MEIIDIICPNLKKLHSKATAVKSYYKKKTKHTQKELETFSHLVAYKILKFATHLHQKHITPIGLYASDFHASWLAISIVWGICRQSLIPIKLLLNAC